MPLLLGFREAKLRKRKDAHAHPSSLQSRPLHPRKNPRQSTTNPPATPPPPCLRGSSSPAGGIPPWLTGPESSSLNDFFPSASSFRELGFSGRVGGSRLSQSYPRSRAVGGTGSFCGGWAVVPGSALMRGVSGAAAATCGEIGGSDRGAGPGLPFCLLWLWLGIGGGE